MSEVPLAEVARALDASAVGDDPLPSEAVRGVAIDSRHVVPGDLFVAAPGAHGHGAAFVPAAIDAGAVAVLTDPAGVRESGEDVGVPLLVVESPRAVAGSAASLVYGHPARDLRMLAVTGTQGKTTTTRIAEAALQQLGERAGAIGTLGTRIAGGDVPSAMTTPEAPDLHALLAVMREREVGTCVMEVSSHAMVMGRVAGVTYDVAAFTNLGRDHLDFHADLEDYFAAKARLFTPAHARLGLVNIDDPYGRRLADEAEIEIRTFGVEPGLGERGPGEQARGLRRGARPDWQAVDVRPGDGGSTFTVVREGQRVAEVELAMPGIFNVANALCALAMLAESGHSDVAALAGALGSVAGVPGRMERVDAGQDFLVVVDYAHKPDAVAAVLAALRPQTTGRLIVVLGAGGDRDTGKRELMGRVAAERADILVVTDDNPRTESPEAIRAAILRGARGGGAGAEIIEIGDRRTAIARAVQLARAGDTVVIAGKGHESGQEVNGVVTPFDDRVVVREELARA